MEFSPESGLDRELADVAVDFMKSHPYEFVGVARGEAYEIVTKLRPQISEAVCCHEVLTNHIRIPSASKHLGEDQIRLIEEDLAILRSNILGFTRSFFRVTGFNYESISHVRSQEYYRKNRLFPFFTLEFDDKEAALIFYEIIDKKSSKI